MRGKLQLSVKHKTHSDVSRRAGFVPLRLCVPVDGWVVHAVDVTKRYSQFESNNILLRYSPVLASWLVHGGSTHGVEWDDDGRLLPTVNPEHLPEGWNGKDRYCAEWHIKWAKRSPVWPCPRSMAPNALTSLATDTIQNTGEWAVIWKHSSRNSLYKVNPTWDEDVNNYTTSVSLDCSRLQFYFMIFPVRLAQSVACWTVELVNRGSYPLTSCWHVVSLLLDLAVSVSSVWQDEAVCYRKPCGRPILTNTNRTYSQENRWAEIVCNITRIHNTFSGTPQQETAESIPH